jgi:RimJ/RimL family protein N-acetyltransferase
MPPIPALTEPLRDDEVSLRLAAERDIPEILIAYQDDSDLHEQLGEKRPPSGAELGSRSERADAERQSGTSVTLTIVESGFDVCIGQVAVHLIDWEQSRAELSIWVAPRRRKRGYAQRAQRLASGWLYETCGLRASCAHD